ncbi:HAMP domain-containing sensor histidine kinase [Streptomyces sp. NPDC049954]|uniref:HAMP domain-containing sensor histidine kinase n=1 Tax=Streptomyces sp. NPDC049954 TaxID=3155779 RepID=UPI00343044D1
MRWALVKVCLLATTLVVLAFAVPLGLVVEQTAHDRAVSRAERMAAAIAPTLSVTTERGPLERAMATVAEGGPDRLAVHIPAGAGAPAQEAGRQRAGDGDIDTVRRTGHTTSVPVPGGRALLRPAALGTGQIAVIEVYVPQGEAGRGVTGTWLLLGGVGVLLVVGAVAVADRLGVRMVRPATQLAAAAQELGEGRLGVRVAEQGPAELRMAAAAFNSMADRVTGLLAAERELAADLSHRLRTPLTALRLNAASLGNSPAAEQTRSAVEQLEREVDTLIRSARSAHTAGKRPDRACCDVAEAVRERMAFWSALAEDEGRAARVSGVGRAVSVPVARGELSAVLDALLGNVFRHTEEGTAFAVDVVEGAAHDAVFVVVSDAGPGIGDPGKALRRGGGAGAPGSTGLGLDIARRLAESTGGDLRIGRSALGGAEVRLRLRTRAGDAGDTAAVGAANGSGHRGGGAASFFNSSTRVADSGR